MRRKSSKKRNRFIDSSFFAKLFWQRKRINRKRKSQEEGYILVTVFGLLIATVLLFVAYSLATNFERKMTLASADSNNGFYAAESGLNIRAEEIRQKFVGYNQPNGTSPNSFTACVNQAAGNVGTGDFACETHQLSAGNGNPSGLKHQAFTYVVQQNGGVASQGTVPRGQPFQNLNMLEYGYQIYSLSQKDQTSTSEAILEMDIKSRLIPMFQFAAFYNHDLEILPSPPMNLNGPIHTNADLYLGSEDTNTTDSPHGLNINGQITLVGSLYNKRKDNNSINPDGQYGQVKVADPSGNLKNLLDANNSTPTTSALAAANLLAGWNGLIQTGVASLTLPSPSFLGINGDYYNDADLRVQYQPNNLNLPHPLPPFAITAIDRSSIPSSSLLLDEGPLRSLMQPVLVSASLASAGMCNTVTPPTGITLPQSVVNALQVAIVSQYSTVPFSLVSNTSTTTMNAAALSGVNTTLQLLANMAGSPITPSQYYAIQNLTPAQIAAATGSSPRQCFVPPPVQNITNFYNNREQRNMKILQLNLKSLAAWNQQGLYAKFINGTYSSNNNGIGFPSNNILFKIASADSNAPIGSFQNLGLAASDTSEEGLVFHATIDTNTYTDASGNTSPYGFALTGGDQLLGLAKYNTTSNFDPTGLTVVSDQAIYIQGHYNFQNGLNDSTGNPLTQPAAVMADSINVLSSQCFDSNYALNCGVAGVQKLANDTTINAAFLASTDDTNGSSYSGGLENYPRFLENWQPTSGKKSLTYRGSFVSLGIPIHVSGRWNTTPSYYTPPARYWYYDTAFNDPKNLPPLSPRFVYLRQEQFVRTFN